MTSLLRRFRGLAIALAVLAITAGAVFATAPSAAPTSAPTAGSHRPTATPTASPDADKDKVKDEERGSRRDAGGTRGRRDPRG